MSEVVVLYKSETHYNREKGEKPLQWYDSLRGEMLSFHGGRLGFEYREDEYIVSMSKEERVKRGITSTYRMLPKVEDVEIINYNKKTTVTNEKEVKKWFDSYVNYNITNASIIGFNRIGLAVNIPEDELDDFLYQAERQGLRTIKQ